MTLPETGPDAARKLVDYAASLDCIHCGLCLQSCPTFRLTGVESSSPRGRIHLMRAVGEGRLEPGAAYREELDFCLVCRSCESVCPAGVRFGEMMGVARAATEGRVPRGRAARLLRWLGFRVLLPHRLALRAAGSLLRAAQVLRLDRLAARLAGRRGRSWAHLPRVAPLPARRLLPAHAAAEGAETGRVLLLEGCVQPELFPQVGRATLRSLTRLGVACTVPRGAVCCGALHAHNGDREGARALARQLVEAFEGADAAAPVVVNSPGCTAHLKELTALFEEGDPWHARAAGFAARVRDYCEEIDARLGERTLDLRGVPSPLAWDDPCHLCHGQGVRAAPRAVLERMRGVDAAPLADSERCCGSAGVYAFLRPDDAAAVFEPKLAAFRASGARLLVTANPGCQLQWHTGLSSAGEAARAVHLAELVEHGLRPSAAAAGPGRAPGS